MYIDANSIEGQKKNSNRGLDTFGYLRRMCIISRKAKLKHCGESEIHWG